MGDIVNCRRLRKGGCGAEQQVLCPAGRRGRLAYPALLCEGNRSALALVVQGAIGNSITTSESGAKRTMDWKRSVCSAVFKARGTEPWVPSARYLITIAF